MLLLTGVSVYKHGKQCQDRGDTCTMIIMINNSLLANITTGWKWWEIRKKYYSASQFSIEQLAQ